MSEGFLSREDKEEILGEHNLNKTIIDKGISHFDEENHSTVMKNFVGIYKAKEETKENLNNILGYLKDEDEFKQRYNNEKANYVKNKEKEENEKIMSNNEMIAKSFRIDHLDKQLVKSEKTVIYNTLKKRNRLNNNIHASIPLDPQKSIIDSESKLYGLLGIMGLRYEYSPSTGISQALEKGDDINGKLEIKFHHKKMYISIKNGTQEVYNLARIPLKSDTGISLSSYIISKFTSASNNEIEEILFDDNANIGAKEIKEERKRENIEAIGTGEEKDIFIGRSKFQNKECRINLDPKKTLITSEKQLKYLLTSIGLGINETEEFIYKQDIMASGKWHLSIMISANGIVKYYLLDYDNSEKIVVHYEVLDNKMTIEKTQNIANKYLHEGEGSHLVLVNQDKSFALDEDF